MRRTLSWVDLAAQRGLLHAAEGDGGDGQQPADHRDRVARAVGDLALRVSRRDREEDTDDDRCGGVALRQSGDLRAVQEAARVHER